MSSNTTIYCYYFISKNPAVARGLALAETKIAEDTRKMAKLVPKANMDKLDDYMNHLYEDDMNEYIVGTTAILDLARFPVNQEELIQNESLML